MTKSDKLNKIQREFTAGRMSRRNFLRAASALGVVATAPYILSAAHAEMSATGNYDYIVLGAGSSGCVVAARMAEDSGKKILVIEAGPSDTEPSIHVPAAFPYLFKTPLDWDYTSTPQTGLKNHTVYMPRGKVLGGSSSINAMIYMRGNPANYNSWGANNPGWNYADVLPYFKKSENNERGGSAIHGSGGPLNVADQRDPNVLSKAMVTAAKEQGYAHNNDFNDGSQEGFGLYQVNQKGGFRASAADAFLHPAVDRGNVTIQGESLIKKLVIKNGRCTGVTFEADGKDYTVTAKREVILSCGAFGSPQVLMLSGIGPKADLQALGIKVIKDLPGVGKNLQDHAMVPVAYSCTKPVSLAGASAPEQAELLKKGMGLLTSNIGEAGGLLKVNKNADAPDLQFHFAPNYFIADGAGNPKGDGFTLLPGIVGTKSVGSLKLTSADPKAKPDIDPAIMSDEHDLNVVVEGVKIARKILNSAAFDDYRGEEVLPGAAVQSDEEIKDFIRNNTQTIYHPVGTCKMGSDKMAVVDAELKVHGIKGLRIADASIMPTIVNSNTNAPCYMIGEKCADFVKAST